MRVRFIGILFFLFTPLIASGAPARVTDLRVINVGPMYIEVEWTTPALGAGATMLMENDIRFSTVAITALNWASRTQTVGEPTPVTPGGTQTMRVNVPQIGVTYFIAIKVRDNLGWATQISNVVSDKVSLTGKQAVLSWIAPSQPGLRGYRVCQSKISGYFPNCIDVGMATTYTFTGLSWGTPDYFVATAYFDGVEFAQGMNIPLSVAVSNSCFPNPNVENWVESCISNEASKN